MSSDAIKTAFKEGFWDSFNGRYPGSGGYITLSAVGFNDDKTLAVVCTGSSCGGLCGRWGFHVLEKVNGVWKAVAVSLASQCPEWESTDWRNIAIALRRKSRPNLFGITEL